MFNTHSDCSFFLCFLFFLLSWQLGKKNIHTITHTHTLKQLTSVYRFTSDTHTHSKNEELQQTKHTVFQHGSFFNDFFIQLYTICSINSSYYATQRLFFRHLFFEISYSLYLNIPNAASPWQHYTKSRTCLFQSLPCIQVKKQVHGS